MIETKNIDPQITQISADFFRSPDLNLSGRKNKGKTSEKNE